jgi:hypothetical protein
MVESSFDTFWFKHKLHTADLVVGSLKNIHTSDFTILNEF